MKKKNQTAHSFLISAVTLIVVVFLVVTTAVVSAQETVTPSDNTEATSSGETIIRTTGAETIVYQKSQLEADIEEVKRTYRGQLAEYRDAEQDHQVAKNQFEQLNTLSSLETAVQSTREALVLRDQVLETYFKLLELELLNAEGLNVEYREFALERVVFLQKALTRHREQVLAATDRGSINRAVLDFREYLAPIELASGFSRSVLQLARFQALYDKTFAFYNRLSDQIETPQQERAFEQIGVQLEEVDFIISEADLTVVEYMVEDENDPLKLTKEIDALYANMNQALTFLDELVGALL